MEELRSKMKKIKVIKVMQNVEDKYRSYMRKLRRERDQLAEEVANQAQCNYAREPKFVKDRWRLRQLSGEVAQLLRQINRPLGPIVNKLTETQRELSIAARELEDESEMVIKRFEQRQQQQQQQQQECDQAQTPKRLSLAGAGEGGKMKDDVDEGASEQREVKSKKNQHNGDDEPLVEFIRDYVQVRKRMHAKQTLANRLSNELACYESSWKSFATTKLLASNATTKANTSSGGGGSTTGCHSPIRRGAKQQQQQQQQQQKELATKVATSETVRFVN